jgi:putative ABC transport system permease protein
MVIQLPLRDPGNNVRVWPADQPPVDAGDANVAYTRRVLPGYFEAMRIPILAGRAIEATDRAGQVDTLVISQSLAKALFPGENPLGRRVVADVGGDRGLTFEVVGVVGDARLSWIGGDPGLAMYHSFYQLPSLTMRIAIRTALVPESIAGALRSRVRNLDRDVPIEEVTSMEAVIRESVAPVRNVAGVLSAFSTLAVLLAAIGLYGMLAAYVTQRTHEIGVRIALGARPGDVLRLVLKRGFVLVGIGLALGIVAALVSTRVIRDQLYGIAPTDSATYASVSALFLGVALVACALPAWRAARVDPIEALREP